MIGRIILVCFSFFLIFSDCLPHEATKSEDKESFESHLMSLKIPSKYKLPEIKIGSSRAKKELIIYFSYTCPHCREFHEDEYPKFKKKYIDTGKIRVIFRNYIDDVGALEAAQLVRGFCYHSVRDSREAWLRNGSVEEKFMQLSNLVLRNQKEWMKSQEPRQFLKKLFAGLGFKMDDIEKYLKNTDIGAGLMLEQQHAMRDHGVSSMPAFIYKQQMWIGAVSCEELRDFCELN